MDNYTVNEREITEILSIAFEKGWSGYKDTKEAVIQELAQEFLKTKRKVRKRATKKKARPRNPREWYDNDVPQEGSWATPNEDGETWTIPDGSTFTTDGNYDIHRMLSGMVPPTQDEEEEEGQ